MHPSNRCVLVHTNNSYIGLDGLEDGDGNDKSHQIAFTLSSRVFQFVWTRCVVRQTVYNEQTINVMLLRVILL